MLFSYATLICGCLLSITFLFLFDSQFENVSKTQSCTPSPKASFSFEGNQGSVSKKNFRSIIQQDVGQRISPLPQGLTSSRSDPKSLFLQPQCISPRKEKINAFGSRRFCDPLNYPKVNPLSRSVYFDETSYLNLKKPLERFPFDGVDWPKAQWNSIKNICFQRSPLQVRWSQRLEFSEKSFPPSDLFFRFERYSQDRQLGFAKSKFPPSTLVSRGPLFLKNEGQNLLQKLDQLSFRAIGIGFPFLTIGILSGSVWANEAWGSYWNWDPKETWSLITWIIFAIYLHLRFTKNWDGLKSAILATIGFLSVWICFLGVNFLAKGLHSYGWFH